MIHPLAIVDADARLAPDVRVGPWSMVGADVEIGPGSEVGAHTRIAGPTRIGCDNRIGDFCFIGADPQDKKYAVDQDSRLLIGDRNSIREHCTIHRGTGGGGGVTRIGNDNWIMSYVHVAHDCSVRDHVIMANVVNLSGHVEVQDHANLGGYVGVHQYCRIGAHSFASVGSMICQDVPPYVLVSGHRAHASSLNRTGLVRGGFDARTLARLKRAFRLLYRERLTRREALDALEPMAAECAHVRRLVDFCAASTRGIVGGRPRDVLTEDGGAAAPLVCQPWGSDAGFLKRS